MRAFRDRFRVTMRGASADPSERLFTHIRLRLALWYTAGLAIILLLAGLILFVGMQRVLLGPVTHVLAASDRDFAQYWENIGQPPRACSPLFPTRDTAPFVACFDAQGALIGNNGLANLSPQFLSPTLARAALADPSHIASDTVNDGGGFRFGAIRRSAIVARDPSTGRVLGVVQVGLSVEADVHALHTLVTLLLLVGLLTLLASGIGGVVLSARALQPARLAHARQQSFIADASHELRTPLTLLRADAEVLLRGRERLDPDDAALLEDIVTEAEHMGTLAESLLTLARLDNSAYHLERDVIDLAEIASATARRAQVLASERNVTISVEHTEPALVIADRTMIAEAVLILVDNAIKYNQPGGSVSLTTRVEGSHAVFEVSDTGVGIAAEHLAHLGERFYRVDKARSREMGGAGLGLSVARGIAAAHRGVLTLESTPGQGTKATLRLPAASASSR